VSNTAVILLVEDREDDIFLVRRAFHKAQILNPLHVVRSGGEAIAYLAGEAKYSHRDEYPLPRLVLLDLHMPGLDGYDVLSWIRQHDGIRGLPVIVLTSSSLLSDVNKAYQLGASSFFVKDVDFDNAVELFATLKTYWIDLARTPECHRRPRSATGRQHLKP
jgi:CheY-like chemotaxis protein